MRPELNGFLTSALALLALALPLRAAAQDVAITNVRIVVGTGQVIESGTIVVRGGTIASVTAGAAVDQMMERLFPLLAPGTSRPRPASIETAQDHHHRPISPLRTPQPEYRDHGCPLRSPPPLRDHGMLRIPDPCSPRINADHTLHSLP